MSTIQQQRMTGFQKAVWIIVLIFALGTIASVFEGSRRRRPPDLPSGAHRSLHGQRRRRQAGRSRRRARTYFPGT